MLVQWLFSCLSPREIDREGIRKKWEKRPLDVPSSSDAKVTWAWRMKKQAMSAPISQRAFFFFFHRSYFQCSQEQKWPAIKTLLKHFCCCQRPRGGVPSPNAEMLSPRSSSPPLSILWAGRCKMSNNLIWASKFYSAFSRQERGGVACAFSTIIWPSVLNLLKPFKTASLHSEVLKGKR